MRSSRGHSQELLWMLLPWFRGWMGQMWCALCVWPLGLRASKQSLSCCEAELITLLYQGILLWARTIYQYLLEKHRMGSFVMPQKKMCTVPQQKSVFRRDLLLSSLSSPCSAQSLLSQKPRCIFSLLFWALLHCWRELNLFLCRLWRHPSILPCRVSP